MFQELKHPVGVLEDRDLWCWQMPGAAEVFNFVWDTRVPEVTEPWPTIPFESIEVAISTLSPQTRAVLTEQTMIMEVIS